MGAGNPIVKTIVYVVPMALCNMRRKPHALKGCSCVSVTVGKQHPTHKDLDCVSRSNHIVWRTTLLT